MMRRRDFLRGVSMAALTAAWSRVAGAVGIVPSPPTSQQASRYFTAGDLDERMWRDLNRGKIDPHFFLHNVFKRSTETLRLKNNGEIDEITASAQVLALHSESLNHPPPPREIPPLPAGEVGVDEVMALLRRAIAGEARIVVKQPWTDVFHTEGEFAIDGWRLSGFRRTHGLKYVSEAIAPDCRRGAYYGWSAREGNPVHLLDNDEQDALDELMEALTP